MTNANWIRSMNDEELCWFLMHDGEFPCGDRAGKPPFCDLDKCECKECVSDWLKEEHKE